MPVKCKPLNSDQLRMRMSIDTELLNKRMRKTKEQFGDINFMT